MSYMNFIVQGISIECDRVNMPYKGWYSVPRTELLNQIYHLKDRLCRKSLQHITKTLHYSRYGYMLEVSVIVSYQVVRYLFWCKDEDTLNKEYRKVLKLWEKQAINDTPF